MDSDRHRRMGIVMPFTPYKQSLDPETLEAAQAAFDKAWTEIISVPSAYDTEVARNVLAKRIVQAVLEDSERDPERLKAYALEGFNP